MGPTSSTSPCRGSHLSNTLWRPSNSSKPCHFQLLRPANCILLYQQERASHMNQQREERVVLSPCYVHQQMGMCHFEATSAKSSHAGGEFSSRQEPDAPANEPDAPDQAQKRPIDMVKQDKPAGAMAESSTQKKRAEAGYLTLFPLPCSALKPSFTKCRPEILSSPSDFMVILALCGRFCPWLGAN